MRIPAWLPVFALLPLMAQQPPEPQPDPGRPVLRRGGAAQKREPVPAPEERRPAQAPYREVVVDEEGRTEKVLEGAEAAGGEDLLQRAAEAAAEFNGKLPSFICDQFVSRYESKTLKPEWKLKDRVQLDYTHSNVLEIAGGKLTGRSSAVTGRWAAGDPAGVPTMTKPK